MQTAWQAIGEGRGGIDQILGTLAALKNYYGGLPCLRAAALVIANPTANNDQASAVAALANFTKGALCYVTDPVNSELTQTPDLLLLTINRDGRAYGDCDDHVLLFAVLCEALGIACDIAAVKSPGSSFFDHVIAMPWVNGQQTQIDLCAKDGVTAPFYPEVISADAPGASDFVELLTLD